MSKKTESTQFEELGRLVDEAQTVLLLSPDHIDGDSLGSTLALEDIFGELGKTVEMFSSGRVEDYLKHMPGWDRITHDWPSHYDLAILVDTGAPSAIQQIIDDHQAHLAAKPWVVLDHHQDHTPFAGAKLEIIDNTVAATGELIYQAAEHLGWNLTSNACRYLVNAILADTLNLTNPLARPTTVQAFANLVTRGDLNLSEIHRAYRETSAFDPALLQLKGQLLQHVELYGDGRIALVAVDKATLKDYRDKVNPSALIFPDMMWAKGVEVAVVMNEYPNIIRTSLRSRVPIAGEVATLMGGGGHPSAAAFPTEGKSVQGVKDELITNLVRALESYHEAV